MNTKQTPKSCSCFSCKRGKHSKRGHCMRKADEKSIRQQNRMALRKNPVNAIVAPAPIGNYYD